MNTANSSTKLLYFNPAHRRLLMPDWLNEIMKDTFVFLLFELVLGCEFCFDGRIAKMKQELAFLPGKNMLLMIYNMIENTVFDAPLQTGRRKYGKGTAELMTASMPIPVRWKQWRISAVSGLFITLTFVCIRICRIE